MLKTIGRKTSIIIITLLVINIALGAFFYLFLQGAAQQEELNLRQITGQVNSTQSNIAQIEDEIRQINEGKQEFENLQAAGLLDFQDRGPLQDAFDKAQRLSGVEKVRFKIEAASCFVNTELNGSDYVILGSPIEITVDAAEDLSIYNFLDLFRQMVNGYPSLERVQLKRQKDLTADVLKQIGTGQPSDLMQAQIDITWYTIVEKAKVTCN